jgi:hypothetical protein
VQDADGFCGRAVSGLLASDAAKSISGQRLPIDSEMQRNRRQADLGRRCPTGGNLRWRHP